MNVSDAFPPARSLCILKRSSTCQRNYCSDDFFTFSQYLFGLISVIIVLCNTYFLSLLKLSCVSIIGFLSSMFLPPFNGQTREISFMLIAYHSPSKHLHLLTFCSHPLQMMQRGQLDIRANLYAS